MQRTKLKQPALGFLNQNEKIEILKSFMTIIWYKCIFSQNSVIKN